MRWLTSLTFFKRFSIRMRIFLLAGLGMVGMIAMTGAYMLGDISMKSAERNEKMNAGLMKLVDQTAIMALQLRRHEKDFLLSSDKQYAAKYHEAAEHFSALVQAMDEVRAVCSTALGLRKDHGLRQRLPLLQLSVAGDRADALAPFTSLIAQELNVKDVVLSADRSAFGTEVVRPNPRALGPRLGKDVQAALQRV